MSRFHVSQEMLYNCMASVANGAVQRPSRHLDPVEVLIKLKKCNKNEYERFTGIVRLKHSPKPCFRACIIGGEQDIQEAAANQLDFLDLPTLKEIGKDPAVARVLAKKYDAFLVSRPLLSQFNAHLGYAVVGEHKVPIGLSPNQPMMAKVKEAENTAKIRMKHNMLVVAVGHVNMLPEHLVDNVNRVMAYLKRLLKENPKDVHTFRIKSRSGPTVKLC